jgi:hypothetical protein
MDETQLLQFLRLAAVALGLEDANLHRIAGRRSANFGRCKSPGRPAQTFLEAGERSRAPWKPT